LTLLTIYQQTVKNSRFRL